MTDTIDQHDAGERLAETVALLRIAGRVAQLGGWTIQLPSRVLTWSDETCAIHDLPAGYKPTLEEGLGYFPPECRAEVIRHVETCIREGTGYDFEVPKLTATGRRIWVRSIGEAVRDAEGRIIGLQGAFQDITSRRHAEQALRAELETERSRLITAQAVANIGSWETELATLTTVWSAETHRIFETPTGFHPTHTHFLQSIHPEDRAAVEEAFIRSHDDGSPVAIEHRLLMPDGRIKFIEERWRIACDELGTPERAIGTCQDITERHRAQDEARQKDTLIRMAGRLTRTGGWAIELPGEQVFWSDELFDILEFPRGRMPPLADALAVYPEPWREKIVAAIRACREDGTPFDLETEVLTATGARKWVRVSAEAGRDPTGAMTRVNGAFQDITERRHLEQQYLRAQRMESIGTLAGGIAHDLNNVLAPILLSIGLLHEDEVNADRLETLAAIEASAKRGAAMVARLLSFARGADGRREHMPIAPLVRDLSTIVRDTFPKNIAFAAHLNPDLWALQADATQLHQVLLNLCVNARDAMPAGGHITVTARNTVVDQTYANVNIDAQPGPYVVLSVEDTGTGIAKDILDKIYDPFFTTKDIGKGTGLGLATSLAIVTGHRGFMRVHSTPGTGTRFDVYLPAQTAPATQPVSVPAEGRPRGHGETVLVVDDEAGIRHIAKRTLEAFGYRVLLASDGAEAIAVYVQHQSDIAVVLTDMMMPVMDGPATIQALVRLNPQVHIIAASGLTTDTKAAGEAAARVIHFLPKPYTSGTLLTAIRAALRAVPGEESENGLDK